MHITSSIQYGCVWDKGRSPHSLRQRVSLVACTFIARPYNNTTSSPFARATVEMITAYLVATLPAAVPLAGAINITVPLEQQALHLNYTTIEMYWSDTQGYQQVDLQFAGPGFSYGIASNLSTSANRYAWNPQNVTESMQQSHFNLTNTAAFSIGAFFHNVNSTAGATVRSDNYTVSEYPFITSDGSALVRPGGVSLVVLAIALALLV